VNPAATSIDSCAALLASVDKRAHSRALLQDANQVLEAIVLPMGFPWNHKLDPHARIIPRDIDELPAILTAGADDQIRERMQLKKGLQKSKKRPPGSRICVQRSADPGVIELTSFSEPTMPQRAAVQPLQRNESDDDDVGKAGELSLRVFQEVQTRKRQRVDLQQSCKKTKLVSLRLGSTSSRSTIFELPHEGKLPLLLSAVLPSHVQDGRKTQSEEGKAMVDELGSYNCRSLQSGKNSGRVFVGRTRLVWTEKDPFDLSQRTYRSLLTGRKIDNWLHKRPREIKVSVRLNGFILTSARVLASSRTAASLSSTAEEQAASYSGRLVDEALATALATASSPSLPLVVSNRLQCTLDHEKFLAAVLEKRKSDCVGLDSNLVRKIRRPFDTIIFEPEHGTYYEVTPPKLDCFPTEEGMQRVVCSASGGLGGLGFLADSTVDDNAAACFLDYASQKDHLCSICWTDSSSDAMPDNELLQCSKCKTLVHKACHGDYEARSAGRERSWKCNHCEAGSQYRTDAACEICQRTRGSMRKRSSGKWVHDVCRIWCDPKIAPTTAQLCALCSKTSKHIIQCAGAGCQVSFHPMCAIFASQAAKLDRNANRKWTTTNNNAMETTAIRDAFLCTQYRLSMIDTCVAQATGTIPRAVSRLFPVAFCGYHNPDREHDFCGLYPGGSYLADAMRIPPRSGTTPAADTQD